MSPSLTRLPSCSCRRPRCRRKVLVDVGRTVRRPSFALLKSWYDLEHQIALLHRLALPDSDLAEIPVLQGTDVYVAPRVDLADISLGDGDVHCLGAGEHDLTVLLVASFRGSLAVGLAVALGLNENERRVRRRVSVCRRSSRRPPPCAAARRRERPGCGRSSSVSRRAGACRSHPSVYRFPIGRERRHRPRAPPRPLRPSSRV